MRPLFGPVPQRGPLEIVLMLIVGVGIPLAIAGLLGKIALDRQHGVRPASPPDVEDSTANDTWWWILAAQPLGFLLLFVMAVAYAVLPIPFMAPFPVPYVLIGLLWLLKFVAPVAVYFDRRAVAVSDWSPSIAYYLVILPVVGVLLAAIYLYERHDRVGVP